ncbi:MAG: methyl-accepting chemotaxis protein [Oceanospirillaceae bacterium]|nr:methyl-accepting chemotaxis protein [Oceanospirillaceae bacterium]
MQILRDMSIGKKINTIVVVLIGLLVGTSIFGLLKISAIGNEMQAVKSEDMPLVELISAVTVKQLETAILVEKAMRIANISDSTETIVDLHSAIKEFSVEIDKEIKQGEEILRIAKTHPLSNAQFDTLNELEKSLLGIEKEHHLFDIKTEHLMELLENGVVVTAVEVENIELAQANINSHLEHTLIAIEHMTEHAMETIAHDEELALQGMIWIGLISSFIGIALGIVISRAITRPLAYAVETANKISEGDLTRSIEVKSKDETGQLLLAMQTMSENFSRMIKDIAQTTEQLTDATHTVTRTTEQTAKSLLLQKDDLSQASTAMHEMSATVQEVSRSALQAAQATSEAEQEAKRGGDVVSRVSQSINSLASEIKNTQNIISRLDKETENVDSILEVITSIAEQTNLLALNAAIEAARAGEQGRGFAVVADEVRTLASRTQSSISEIQQLIIRLKEGAKDSVQAMEVGHDNAMVSIELSNDAESTLIEITQAVTVINDMNTQIASSVEQQSVVTEQVNISIFSIKTSSDENAAGAEHVAKVTADIALLSERLKALVGRFKIV